MNTAPYPWLADAAAALAGLVAAGRVPQAVLIHGAEGTGRRALAAWFARLLLEGAAPPAGGEVPDLAALRHPDVLVSVPEEDRKVVSVAQIRELTAFLALTSHQGGRKVAVIWPAEAMNANAANALLKTLEEPSGPSTLVLVASTPSRLPATVVSRCQRIRVPVPRTSEALAWLARTGDGGAAWEPLLALAGGGPLRARELAAARAGGLAADLAADLGKLGSGAESPIAVARRWAKEDPVLCLNWLYLELRRRLQRSLGAGGDGIPAPNPGPPPLQIGQRTVTMAAGFAYLDRLLQARRQLDRSLNLELQLADLLMWWFGPAGEGTRRQSPGTPGR